ncbi:MAG: hypothetical protein FWE13_02515 [Firmicutes bacterium]|nr:hypothetical protein [Bacillota bacterium]
MNKKKIFLFAALGAGLTGIVLAIVGGIMGSIDSLNTDLDVLIRETPLLLGLISNIILMLVGVLAIIGTGYLFRKSLISPIFLAVAGVLSLVSLMSFNAFGLVAGILLLGAAALAFLLNRENEELSVA